MVGRRAWVALALAVLAAPASGATMDDVLGLAPLRSVAWDGQVGVWGHGSGVLIVEGSNADGHPDLIDCLADSRFAVASASVEASSNDPILTASGHGSWVAGSICGSGGGLPGHHGMAPGAAVLSWNGFLDDGTGQDEYHRQHDIRIMSHSTLTPPSERWEPLAQGADMTVFWAAGNSGGDGSQSHAVDPQGDDRILVIAAATGDGTAVASYSSRGAIASPETWPDLSAPGCRHVPHPVLDAWRWAMTLDSEPPAGDCLGQEEGAEAAQYRQVWGTSFAAPTVAGTAAMMMQVHPELSPADLRALLLATARPFLPTTDQDADGNITAHDFWLQHGHAAGRGMVDPVRAVAAARAMALGTSMDDAVRCATIEGEAFVTACPVRAPEAVALTFAPENVTSAEPEPAEARQQKAPGVWAGLAVAAAAVRRVRSKRAAGCS